MSSANNVEAGVHEHKRQRAMALLLVSILFSSTLVPTLNDIYSEIVIATVPLGGVPLYMVVSAFDDVGKEVMKFGAWFAGYLEVVEANMLAGSIGPLGIPGTSTQKQAIWDHDPLTVSIKLADDVDPSSADLVKAAVSDWQIRIRSRAGVGEIDPSMAPFGIRYVTSSSSADIMITLTGTINASLGYATTISRFGRSDHVYITLPTKAGERLPVKSVDIRNIAAHEFGHALGLGHSTSFGDLMNRKYNVLGTTSIIHPSTCEIDRILATYLGDGFAEPNSSPPAARFSCT